MEHDCILTAKSSNVSTKYGIGQLLENCPSEKIKGFFEKYYVIIPDWEHSELLYRYGSFGYKILNSGKDGTTITLRLTLQEAFFLQFGLNVLNIVERSSNKQLSANDCWSLFRQYETDFIRYYVVYHYYRSKNWCPKSGSKYAGDYVLYKNGPESYHSSYVVLIDTDDSLKYKWSQILPVVRIAETCKKNVLVARILVSERTDLSSLNDPADMKLVAVHELLIDRWSATIDTVS